MAALELPSLRAAEEWCDRNDACEGFTFEAPEYAEGEVDEVSGVGALTPSWEGPWQSGPATFYFKDYAAHLNPETSWRTYVKVARGVSCFLLKKIRCRCVVYSFLQASIRRRRPVFFPLTCGVEVRSRPDKSPPPAPVITDQGR